MRSHVGASTCVNDVVVDVAKFGDFVLCIDDGDRHVLGGNDWQHSVTADHLAGERVIGGPRVLRGSESVTEKHQNVWLARV